MASIRFDPRKTEARASGQGDFTIGGVRPEAVYAPASAQELADLLADASKTGKAIAPVGGATHLALGNAPRRVDWAVSVRNLSRIVAYEPADMTLSVEAGAPLEEVQAVLGERGQALPIEVGDPHAATIGGIVASALYGPRRLGSGTLRDYLIGIGVAYPDGSLAKAGGMVVKNVSGFDLMRMHHGALGTLGVIVSVNFKVLPKARSERTLLVTVPSLADLQEIRTKVMSGRARPVAFEVAREFGQLTAAIRIEGRERIAALLANDLMSSLPAEGAVLDPDQSASYWRDYVRSYDASERSPVSWLRTRARPSEAVQMMDRIHEVVTAYSLPGARLSCSPGLGHVDLRWLAKDGDQVAALTGALRSIAPKTVVVVAPPNLKSTVDAWGDAVESLDLMRILKAEFDPRGTLNPGRYVGGL